MHMRFYLSYNMQAYSTVYFSLHAYSRKCFALNAGAPKDFATAQLHRWPFTLLQGYCVNDNKLHAACACMQEAATPFDSSRRLSELRLSADVLPEILSQTDLACASSRDRISGDGTASHNTMHSTRIRGSDSGKPLKKWKTCTPAERVQSRWGSDLDEFPELRQAALGQWPPRSWKGAEPTSGQAPIGQLFSLPQLHSADASVGLPVDHNIDS